MAGTAGLRNGMSGGKRLFFVLFAAFLAINLALPLLSVAGGLDGPSVDELKQKAQKAYIEHHYKDAAALDAEIADKYPQSDARRYAVLMLGNIYEENFVDLKQAIKWDREFLKGYADYRQARAYREKIAFLEKMLPQESVFREYQAIKTSGDTGKVLAKKYEALLKHHPDFMLKDSIESELGYTYASLDEREKSYEAFKVIASEGKNRLSATDRASYGDVRRYWRMTTTWAYAAWFVIAALWAWVIAMRPWKRLSWRSARRFMIYPALWVIGIISCIPIYNDLHVEGYPIIIPISAMFIAGGLNLIVLLWLLLLVRGQYWQTRPRFLRMCSPVLTLVMTVAVLYLCVVYYPQGPHITDLFRVKYKYWSGEYREHGFSFRIPGR